MSYARSSDTGKYWEHAQVEITTAGTNQHITNLRGGESITIKAMIENNGYVYIGSDKLVSATNGYELDSGETVTLTLPVDFGLNNFIEIWADTSNSGDDLCYVKLIDLYPQTMATPITAVVKQ